MKKMNTMTLQQTAKTSQSLRKQSQFEINKRKKAAQVIKKQYIALKKKKIKHILKNGMNVMNEYVYVNRYPNNINNNLSNEFLIQYKNGGSHKYKISNKEETSILKELIQYLLDSTLDPERALKRSMNSRVNYVMKTSIENSTNDLREIVYTYKRFYAA